MLLVVDNTTKYQTHIVVLGVTVPSFRHLREFAISPEPLLSDFMAILD
jgi:hypothetical protein